MQRASSLALALAMILTMLPLPAAAQPQRPDAERREASALRAPFVPDPPDGTRLPSVGPVSLGWDLPAGAEQVQVQVTPFNGDGPAVNLIRNADERLTLPAPPAEYVLLPGMTYTWRVRVTPEITPVTQDDASWSPWSAAWRFVTPPPNSAAIRPGGPADGEVVAAEPAVLRWNDTAPGIFYYEVQVSHDREFRTGNDATAPVWWNLAHGGASAPPNSWTTPPLEAGTVYFWRVRPRVQGDGTPADWSQTWSFTVAGTPAAPPPSGPAPEPHAFQPTDIAGSVLWLAADRLTGLTPGAPVISWADLSGYGNTMTQSWVDARPTWQANAIGGKPAVRFDGKNDFLLVPHNATLMPAHFSIFVVTRLFSSTDDHVLVSKEAEGTAGYSLAISKKGDRKLRCFTIANGPIYMTGLGTTTLGTTTPYVMAGTFDDIAKVYLNGVQEGYAYGRGAMSPSFANLEIGRNARGAEEADADIAEVIIYNRALGAEEMRLVSQYLGGKYTIAVAP
ncbi:MAG: hypothetical protein NTZ05_14845 [Chloroflexi bacterium]|nr:hypothetical protein [Chloroflexota bacterium]